MAVPLIHEATWERMIRAVEKVRERCDKAAKALDAAGVLYAVIGGNAVANWVARIDEEAVRNTRDVDMLIRREDLEAAWAYHAAHPTEIETAIRENHEAE